MKFNPFTAELEVSGGGGGSFLPLAGGTMIGTLTLDPAAQTGSNDAATIAQVQAFISGLIWKSPAAQVAFSTNQNIASPGTLISGSYTVLNGNTVVLTGQTDSRQNGIYIYNGPSSPMTRRSDVDSSTELNAATISVLLGTFSGYAFTQITPNPVVGTDPIQFVSLGNSYIAGSGLNLTGNTFSIPSNAIVDSMVDPLAQIAGTKIDPSFGAQAVSGLNFQALGTAGGGYLFLERQNISGPTPVTGINLFSDNADRLTILKSGGILNSFAFSSTASRVFTFPDVNDTVVTLVAAQTIQNKTLHSATIGTTTASVAPIVQPTAPAAQGDIFYTAGNGRMAQLPIGLSGQVLLSNGIEPTWANLSLPYILNSSVFDDFAANSIVGWAVSSVNTPAANGISTGVFPQILGNYYGVLYQAMGSAATAQGAGCGHSSNNVILGGNLATYTVETRLYLPVLSSATDRFITEFGWSDSNSGAANRYLQIAYSDNLNGGKFEIQYSNGTTSGVFDSGIPVVANNWYKLAIVVNPAASQVQFFINGSVIFTATTSIPSGSSLPVGLRCKTRKTAVAGTATRQVFWDYLLFKSNFVSSR